MSARSAFTLAEVLIVIAIIGVVSAMVLPNLVASNKERVAVSKLKKIYSTLYEAHRRAEVTYGPVRTWFSGATTQAQWSERYATRVLESMSVVKTCGLAANQGCFSKAKVQLLNTGTVDASFDPNLLLYKVILSNGMSVFFYIASQYGGFNYAAEDAMVNNPYETVHGQIIVDLDGPKGANTYGVDLFMFVIIRRGIYPSGSRLDIFGNTDEALKTYCLANGRHCAGWVLETGNMEYLKADGTGKCPNGSMLGWENTSCK